MSDRDIQDELATVADEAEARRDDPPRGRRRSARPPRDPSQVYSVRIPVDRLEDLRRLAAERGAAPTGLMRQWVLERLDLEQAGHFRQSIRGTVEVAGIGWTAESVTSATALAAMLHGRFDRIEAYY